MGATGKPENMLSPGRVRRIYTPFHPASVGTANTAGRTITRSILQDALYQANIDLDAPPLTSTPIGLGSLTPTTPPPAVRPEGIGVPTRPRRPTSTPNPSLQWSPPSPSQLRTPGRRTHQNTSTWTYPYENHDYCYYHYQRWKRKEREKMGSNTLHFPLITLIDRFPH